jgi:hypothetical protein
MAMTTVIHQQTLPPDFPVWVVPVVVVVFLVIYFVPLLQIIHKAGYSRWWLLIWLVPFANIVFLWIFAFSRWPIEREK